MWKTAPTVLNDHNKTPDQISKYTFSLKFPFFLASFEPNICPTPTTLTIEPKLREKITIFLGQLN